MAADAQREQDEESDRDHCDPRPGRELGDRGGDEDDRGEETAGGVEREATTPVGVVPAPPVNDHPGLRHREGEKNAHCEQRNQGRRLHGEPDEDAH